MTPSSFPLWLQDCLVADTSFERAYHELSAQLRSRLKRCIAQLCDLCGQGLATGVSEETTMLRHSSGFVQSTRNRPLEWCLVLLDESLGSAPRLLAAVLPPLLAGVSELVVLRLCSRRASWPAGLLAGLELAGVEQVAQCPASRCQELLEHLAGQEAHGVVLLPGQGDRLSRSCWQILARAPRIRLWQSGFQGRAGLFDPDPLVRGWDYQTLAWSQPGLELEVWVQDIPGTLDQTVSLPSGWKARRGDQAVFLEQKYELVYAPAAMHSQAMNSSVLVLAPGEEGSWVWPGLQPSLFRQQAAAWHASLALDPAEGFAAGSESQE